MSDPLSRPPSGAVVGERVAELILQHWSSSNQRDADAHRIANTFATSFTTVKRIVDHSQQTGQARVPKQGTGKRDDPRWVFAGKGGPANLLRLEGAVAAGKVDDLVSDVRLNYLEDGHGGEPAVRTVALALRERLDYTGKQLTKRARERDGDACDAWMRNVKGKYESRQLVFIDETCAPPSLSRMRARLPRPPWAGVSMLPSPRLSLAALPRRHENQKTANRRYGRAKIGQRARGTVFFHRGTAYSALGVFSLLGMLDEHIVEGGYDADRFLEAFKVAVLPHLNAFPHDHSVVVMDNCPGLHNQLEMVRLIRQAGARIVWLEPYDPEHNPIELAFRTAKGTLRSQREALAVFPRRERLRIALARVGPEAARSHFRECGYDV